MMTSRNFFIGILNTITAMFSKGNHTSSIGSEFGLAMNYDEMPTSFHEKKLYKGYLKKKKKRQFHHPRLRQNSWWTQAMWQTVLPWFQGFNNPGQTHDRAFVLTMTCLRDALNIHPMPHNEPRLSQCRATRCYTCLVLSMCVNIWTFLTHSYTVYTFITHSIRTFYTHILYTHSIIFYISFLCQAAKNRGRASLQKMEAILPFCQEAVSTFTVTWSGLTWKIWKVSGA